MHRVLCLTEAGEKAAGIVADTQCDGLPCPEEQQPCNLELTYFFSSMFSLRWKVTQAGPCSSSCGLGLAAQLVTCVQVHQDKEILLEEHLCPVAEKPLTSVPCVIRMCSYEWSFSEWTEVSAPADMQQSVPSAVFYSLSLP